MYELVVNDKVQRENINSINYFRDDKLVQQAISDMEKLMAERQQSKEQEHSSTKKSVLDALRSLKAKKQEQPAQEQSLNCCTIRSSLKTVQRNAPKNPAQSKTTI